MDAATITRTDIIEAYELTTGEEAAWAAWTHGNNAGDGFDPTPDADEGEDIGVNEMEARFGELLIEATQGDDVAVYDDGDSMTLVAYSSGPWAVRLA